MIKNYFRVAIGNFKKHTLAMCVNILGLAISLAALLAIAFFIRNELAYDEANPDHDRIFRITEVIDSGSYVENSSSLPYPMADAIQMDFPDMVEEVTQIFDFQVPVKSMKLENNELFNEEAIYYADSNVFHFFEIPLLSGTPEKVLNKPFSLIVSEELGKKWYGEKNPVGQTVLLSGNEKFRCEITGVYKLKSPSHFAPRAIISMSTVLAFAPGMKKNWVWNPVWTYVKLKPGVSIEHLKAQLPVLVQKHEIPQLRNMVSLHAQALNSIHLESHLEFEMAQNSDRKYIYIFLSCAIFLIVVAVVNFVNLTTVTLAARMKEVGVRRVSGATPTQLMIQFIFESVLITFLSFLIGLLILFFARPMLENGLQIEIPTQYLFDPTLVAIFGCVIMVTGVISGLYPALVITRIKTTELFKGGMKGSRGGRIFRKTLVAVQFCIAVVLIVFTLLAQKQFEYMHAHDNGYSTENVITMYMGGTELPFKFDEFRNLLLQDSRIKDVSMMNEIIGVNNNNHEYRFGDMTGDEFQYMPALVVDEHFANTLNLKLLAGRDYDKDMKTEDSLAVLVNRSLAKYLGYENPEDAINKRFSSLSGEEHIVGVVEDFNSKSLHHPVGPFVLDIESRNQFNHFLFAKYAVIKLNDMSQSTLDQVKKAWDSYVTNATFDYTTLDNELQKMYRRESVMNKVLAIFSMLAILIACLGLFALTRVLAGMKSKELAIRKVLGAGLTNLIYVATKEQMAMIGVALVVGFPIAYLVIHRWMQSFAYRIEQDVFSYLIAAVIAIGIAFFTIFFLALNVASKNPAPVLKCE